MLQEMQNEREQKIPWEKLRLSPKQRGPKFDGPGPNAPSPTAHSFMGKLSENMRR